MGVILNLSFQAEMNMKRAIPILLLLALQNHFTKGTEKYTITKLESNEIIHLETLSKINNGCIINNGKL